MGKECIILSSRESFLALKQAEEIKSQLESLYPSLRLKIKKVKTKVDTLKKRSLSSFDSKGIFTKELDEALIRKEIDIAVHSLKDLPTRIPDDLTLACIPKRHSPYDALISKGLTKLKDLPKRARIGTSSPRRKAFLLSLRGDLIVEPIRGNLDTRIRKLDNGEFDGLVLSEAAINRIGLQNKIAEVFKDEDFLPQAGQGALGVIVRDSDRQTKKLLEPINHNPSYIEVMAEREFLNALGGGCRLPVGILAKIEASIIKITSVILSPDGKKKISKNISGNISQALSLANKLAMFFKNEGIDNLWQREGSIS
ncbi:MAG: hydroxymethylbilane synthase [Candidatus Omnitrophica bacterium]|nr:hydroxymethylbilane synthase [Candidatus Omnitrophota bacterium]